MFPPVIFLNENSSSEVILDTTSAQTKAKELIRLLQKIFRLNRKISLNTNHPISNCLIDPKKTFRMVLGGNAFREEWDFLKAYCDRSPLNFGFENFNIQLDGIEYKYNDKTCKAMMWASITDSALVSLNCDASWEDATLLAMHYELLDSGEIDPSSRNIRNLSMLDHVDIHADWLGRFGYSENPHPDVLWAEREQLFPKLRLLPRVKSDFNKLFGSGAPYTQAISRLKTMNGECSEWEIGNRCPNITNATPEAETRKRYCNVVDIDGESYCFDHHTRFTGSYPGRIHFRPAQDEAKLVIAYIGYKLTSNIA